VRRRRVKEPIEASRHHLVGKMQIKTRAHAIDSPKPKRHSERRSEDFRTSCASYIRRRGLGFEQQWSSGCAVQGFQLIYQAAYDLMGILPRRCWVSESSTFLSVDPMRRNCCSREAAGNTSQLKGASKPPRKRSMHFLLPFAYTLLFAKLHPQKR
jgi:hypothetical protein